MSQTVDLKHIEKESRGMFAEDGLLYIFLGLLLLLVGVGFAVPALSGLVGLCAFLIFPLEALRRRITYPRIGYARFSAPSGMVRGILVFAAITVFSLAVIAFAGGGRFQRYLPLCFGIVFALTFYFGFSTHGTRGRDWLIIGLALLVGLIATLRYEDWHDGAAVLFSIVGVFSLLIGAIKLARFVRKYPLAADSEPQEL
jgi:hypothetical protein